MSVNKQKPPSAKRIVARMLVTLLLIVGLIVCFRYCSQTMFLVVFIATVSIYIVISLVEASRSHGNRAKWGKGDGDQ